ncbi:Crp/Fnr family transcriptional regulator [Streptomyces sp. CA-132043]|uniref:Crp/Fnr family transcriptional regulator n=1 Tax=Streptomyces sp. CA-132043 TaxID=3240048 RepID=UPI003D8A06A4
MLLESGSALIILAGDGGARTLLAVRGSGELLGELAVLDDEPRSATVVAAEACRVHIIPAAAFLAFVEEHDLLAPLLRHAITRVRESEAVRLELATASVAVRLASALSRLVDAASATSSDLAVGLTQAELSQMIGASRNAVGAALKPWREEGWVRTASGGGSSSATFVPSSHTHALSRDQRHAERAHCWAPPSAPSDQHGAVHLTPCAERPVHHGYAARSCPPLQRPGRGRSAGVRHGEIQPDP